MLRFGRKGLKMFVDYLSIIAIGLVYGIGIGIVIGIVIEDNRLKKRYGDYEYQLKLIKSAKLKLTVKVEDKDGA